MGNLPAMDDLLRQEREVEELLQSVSAKVVGARLARARKRQGLSIRDLAERANVNKNSIVRLENGGAPQPLTILKLCAAMSIHVATIAEAEKGEGEVIAIHHRTDDRWYDLENFGAGPVSSAPLDGQDRQKLARDGLQALMLAHTSRLETGQLLAREIELYGPTEIRSHLGEEMVYVLEGTVRLEVGGEAYELVQGESATFWSSEPHRYAPAEGAPTPVRMLSITVHHAQRTL